MTAVLCDDAALFDEVLDDVVATPVKAPVTASSAPKLTLVPAPKAAPTRRLRFEPPSDPMADMASRMLSIPLRQVYAVLWRVGVIDVRA